jgi:excisionase family DNA binding protein
MAVNEKDFKSVGEGWVGPLPDILTVEELAQYLRESPVTIRRMFREKEKTGDWKRVFRPGNTYKIPRQDVIDYIEKNYGAIKQ